MLIASNASFSLHGCHFSNAQQAFTTMHLTNFTVVLPHVNSVPPILRYNIIERNLFHGCTKGLEFRSSVKILRSNEVQRFHFDTLGSEVHDATLRLECNEWSYNTTGHRHAEVPCVWVTMPVIRISQTALALSSHSCPNSNFTRA